MPKLRMKRHAVTQPLDPSYKIIALTRGQETMVDAADYPWLNQWNWRAQWNHKTGSFYAVRTQCINGKKGPVLHMAREILGCGPSEQADHKNHDTLDNRRKNLRKATPGQNSCNRRLRSDNSSGYKGVSKIGNRWRAVIHNGEKNIHLGCFKTTEEAAHTYDEAAKNIHGEFAVLNFPQSSYAVPDPVK